MTMPSYITSEDLVWLDNAVGYDNVSTIDAAYARLIKFREMIQAGDVVGVGSSENHLFVSVEAFDRWVRATYPVFADDTLHPVFRG